MNLRDVAFYGSHGNGAVTNCTGRYPQPLHPLLCKYLLVWPSGMHRQMYVPITSCRSRREEATSLVHSHGLWSCGDRHLQQSHVGRRRLPSDAQACKGCIAECGCPAIAPRLHFSPQSLLLEAPLGTGWIIYFWDKMKYLRFKSPKSNINELYWTKRNLLTTLPV